LNGAEMKAKGRFSVMRKEPEKSDRVFRPRRKTILFYALIPAFSLCMSVVYILSDPFDWVGVFFYCFTLLALGGLVELVTTRLVLYPDSIYIFHKFQKRIIDKKEFEKITWEKGADASILLKGGEWVSIPTPGISAQGMCNTIRAWAKRL